VSHVNLGIPLLPTLTDPEQSYTTQKHPVIIANPDEIDLDFDADEPVAEVISSETQPVNQPVKSSNTDEINLDDL